MEQNKKLKVYIIEDSLFFIELLTQILKLDTTFQIIGSSTMPIEALTQVKKLRPDVLILDMHMPKLNGVEFLKRLMPQMPLPVVVVSSIHHSIFDVLKAGAIDFVVKPNSDKKEVIEQFSRELRIKLKIASMAKLKTSGQTKEKGKLVVTNSSKVKLIAIGASTGGTEAISRILEELPREKMPGIVIAQHMPPVFTKMYAKRLNSICKLEVKEAENFDRIYPGKVLIAPGGQQMEVIRDREGYCVKCFQRNSKYAPSVDILFYSVAEILKEQAIGIILTGMGADGADGLLSMKKAGAYTIGQNEKSCIVYGMPKIAYDIGAVIKQSSLQQIPYIISQYLIKQSLL